MPKTVPAESGELVATKISEPAHLADLWNPGGPRPGQRYRYDGFCVVCGKLIPNTSNTWSPIGLFCIRCRLDFGHAHDDWRQRAKDRACRIFEEFGVPTGEATDA